MKILGQRNPLWAEEKLGKSNSKVGRYGCVITSLSMALDYFGRYKDPGYLARNLAFTGDGLLLWGSLPKSTCLTLETRFFGRRDDLIQEALKNPRKVVLIQVENYHWVLGLGRNLFGGYRIADPWFGDKSTTKRYKSITGGAVLKLT